MAKYRYPLCGYDFGWDCETKLKSPNQQSDRQCFGYRFLVPGATVDAAELTLLTKVGVFIKGCGYFQKKPILISRSSILKLTYSIEVYGKPKNVFSECSIAILNIFTSLCFVIANSMIETYAARTTSFFNHFHMCVNYVFLYYVYAVFGFICCRHPLHSSDNS